MATDLVSQYLELHPPLRCKVRNLCVSEGKIPAIKYYREQTGEGLAEAKRQVDEWVEGIYAPGSRPLILQGIIE